MFSYLRTHRRTPSNPSSPLPDQISSWESPMSSNSQLLQPGHSHERPSSAAALPYLPPIPRVSSIEHDSTKGNGGPSNTRILEGGVKGYETDLSKGQGRKQETYTPSNNQKPPYAGTRRPDSAGNLGPSKPSIPQQSRSYAGGSSQESATHLPFVTASDLQSKSQSSRKPLGSRLPSPPPSNISTFEPIQPRSGKTRLNLLNPMALLARRRSAQNMPQISPIGGPGMDTETFDPRIRGTVVHDFSAPRPRKTVVQTDSRGTENAYQRSPNPQSEESPWSGGNHTPVFTENFEEEQYPAAGRHIRKASDTELPLPQPPYARGATRKPVPVASELKSSGSDVQTQDQVPKIPSSQNSSPDIGPPVPPKSEEPSNETRHVSIDSRSLPKPSSSKSRPVRNMSKASSKDSRISGLPSHMKSTSSRFSFDMIGAAEQERLLEERHRQKALERKLETPEPEDEDPYGDDYDYDNMDDDDGLEERIPGVNADAEEDDMYDGYDQFPGFTYQQPLSTSFPMTSHLEIAQEIAQDVNSEVIGVDTTKEIVSKPLESITESNLPYQFSADQPGTVASSEGQDDGFDVQNMGLHNAQQGAPNEAKGLPSSKQRAMDDFYFDDGLIDAIEDGQEESGEFDESIFDKVDTDQYGRPIKSISSLPTAYSPPSLTQDASPSASKQDSGENEEISTSISPGTLPVTGGLVPQPLVANNEHSNFAMIPPQPGPGLTQDTLAAYQSALAAAAFAAAANGKFRRDSSTSPHLQSTPSEQEDAQPGMVTDSSDIYEPFSPSYDDFDYDDAFEDDTIIAAANAEALANDSEGFYGQEFGFYSAPGGGGSEYVNGGYFGARGIEGIARSHSGRIVSREPNLTPITERSEYSNRNSFMSLNLHQTGAVTSPGLAQLAGMMGNDYDGGDMSLTALMKLRNRAWGGSQPSLHSGAGSPKSAAGDDTSSPVNPIAPWGQGGATGIGGHWRQSSLGGETPNSLPGPGTGLTSESSSLPGSPTITMATPSLEPNKGIGLGIAEEPEEDLEKEAQKENTEPHAPGNKDFKRHRYTGSAESISYLKEEDPVTGGRWILERRRTAESGEIELLEREIVSGGRI
ncbi:hypothetical protein F5884DRAFT_657791 [Xylogone sp. PMI_703]|nr:hypothetical protein F5884DRAFT_657791 [Xylogone sp. PMI_703]